MPLPAEAARQGQHPLLPAGETIRYLHDQGRVANLGREKSNLRCIRKPPRDWEKWTGYTGKFPYAPLRVGGYSISYKPGGLTKKGEVDSKWHSHVELHPEAYRNLKALFLEKATKLSAEQLGLMFYEVGYEPYKAAAQAALFDSQASEPEASPVGYQGASAARVYSDEAASDASICERVEAKTQVRHRFRAARQPNQYSSASMSVSTRRV